MAKKTKQVVKAKAATPAIYPPTADNISTAVVLASLEEKAKPAMKKLQKFDKITSEKDMVAVGEQIKLLKEIDKEATKEEKSMIDPINLTMKRIKAHFKPFHDKIGALESEYKGMMTEFLEQSRVKIAQLEEKFEKNEIKKVSTFTSKVNALQVSNTGPAKVRKIKKLVIIDEKKIPKQYLVPDESAIERDLRLGKAVPGCELQEFDSIAI